ncbi:ParA family protein [Spirillospora sp. NPDC050679]
MVIPVDLDEFSLEALKLLFIQVKTLMEEMRRPRPVYRGLVINRIALPMSAINRSIFDSMHALKGVDVIAEVPVRSVLAEARAQGKPVTHYQPRSDVAQMYRDLAKTAGYLP